MSRKQLRRNGQSAPLQYGVNMKVDISDKARAVAALQKEFELLEAKQLDVGEQMAVLVAQQVVLAEKCRLIKQSMMELLK